MLKCSSAYQKLVLVLGLEHGSHLLEVATVALLLQQRGEEDGDDPLGDVGQVKVIVSLHHSLHHPVHTKAPGDRGTTPQDTTLLWIQLTPSRFREFWMCALKTNQAYSGHGIMSVADILARYCSNNNTQMLFYNQCDVLVF